MKANIKFILNPSSTTLKKPIVLKCNSTVFANNYFMFSTGEYASKSQWSKATKNNIPGYVLGDSVEADDINDKLEEFSDAFKDAFKNGIYDKQELKNILMKIKDPNYEDPEEDKEDEKEDFTSIIEYGEYQLDHEPYYYSESAKDMKEMTPSTIKSKKQSIAVLKDFEDKFKYRVTFENCDRNFWKQFTVYLKKKNLSPGTRGRIIKDIRSFLNSAIRQGKDVCRDFQIKSVAPVSKSEKKSIYLNEDEINSVADLELNGTLNNSRDWLLIACGTGLRHSDLSRLNEKNIITYKDFKSIRIKTQKTGALVEIPIIFDWLEDVFIRRNWTFPPIKTPQKLNEDFKIIGRKAKLNRLVEARIRDEDTKFTVLKDVPIAEVISSHIGRRSFVSNIVKKPLSLTMIAKMTGHVKLETLQIYEQLNESETAEAVYYMIRDSKMQVS